MHIRLAHLEYQPFRERRPKWKLVEETTIDSGHRDSAALAASTNRLAQRMRSISRQIKRGLRPVVKRIDRHAVCFQTDTIDASVRSHAAGHLSQLLIYVFVIEVQRLRFAFFGGHVQARGNMIDGNDPFSAKQVSAFNRELT